MTTAPDRSQFYSGRTQSYSLLDYVVFGGNSAEDTVHSSSSRARVLHDNIKLANHSPVSFTSTSNRKRRPDSSDFESSLSVAALSLFEKEVAQGIDIPPPKASDMKGSVDTSVYGTSQDSFGFPRHESLDSMRTMLKLNRTETTAPTHSHAVVDPAQVLPPIDISHYEVPPSYSSRLSKKPSMMTGTTTMMMMTSNQQQNQNTFMYPTRSTVSFLNQALPNWKKDYPRLVDIPLDRLMAIHSDLVLMDLGIDRQEDRSALILALVSARAHMFQQRVSQVRHQIYTDAPSY